jgi:hypothetical protein
VQKTNLVKNGKKKIEDRKVRAGHEVLQARPKQERVPIIN